MLLQNKRWSYFSLILFLKESELSPHLITVEHVEEIMRMIIPNINGKQQEFYSRHIMSEAYHKDADGYTFIYLDKMETFIWVIQE